MNAEFERVVETDEKDPGGSETGRDIDRLKPAVPSPSNIEGIIEKDLVDAGPRRDPVKAGKADGALR